MVERESISEGVINIVRGFTRPACTIIGLVSCVMIYANYQEVPTWLIGFTGMMLTFWFGEETIQRLRGKP